ncbi:hypothetical protein BDP27DRAFT_1371041 [Rhodocollybia butyracea]|uniref:Uncharacterized protein n=1 Tax=Rhodocollybia butyracea TaxID=206335 RepID=A0A9P5PBU4_9AGAR|nr:hypothetical protein BDP27DRAFT_1371041 [Rhodocollybia butyracea]
MLLLPDPILNPTKLGQWLVPAGKSLIRQNEAAQKEAQISQEKIQAKAANAKAEMVQKAQQEALDQQKTWFEQQLEEMMAFETESSPGVPSSQALFQDTTQTTWNHLHKDVNLGEVASAGVKLPNQAVWLTSVKSKKTALNQLSKEDEKLWRDYLRSCFCEMTQQTNITDFCSYSPNDDSVAEAFEKGEGPGPTDQTQYCLHFGDSYHKS